MRSKHPGQFHVINVHGTLVALYPAAVFLIPVRNSKAPSLVIDEAIEGNLTRRTKIFRNFNRPGKLFCDAAAILRMLFMWNAVHGLVVYVVLPVAPFKGLRVEIGQIMKRPAGDEILFDEPDEPLLWLYEYSYKPYYTHHFFIRTFTEKQ